MAMMMRQLYSALRAAGADDDSASRAAEEVANYDNRINKVESDLALLKWMVGTNIALTLTILFKLFH